jgi:predicted RNase H-like HicB family nuclease
MCCCFSYRAIFSREDGEWAGFCAEFPSLSHLAATQSEALQGIATLVASVAGDMIVAGEALPGSPRRTQQWHRHP